jgi:ATP-binding cassette subfamily B protein/ATP-binding cassette subfamily C protein LapB
VQTDLNNEQETKTDSSLKNATKYILDFYFGEIDFTTIQLFSHNKKNHFEIEDAVEVFRNYNLLSFQRNIQIVDIPKHFLPCIAYNEQKEALVILEKQADQVLIYDTKDLQEKRVYIKDLEEYNHALLLFKNNEQLNSLHAPKASKEWFYEPLKANWRTYIEVGLLTLFINFFALAIPLFVMSTYDRVIPNKAYTTLFVLSVGVLIILLFDILLKYARNHILENFSKKIGIFWEEELMRKMLLTNSHFDNYLTGSKANLFKELQHVRDFFTMRSLMQIIDLPFFIIGVSVIYIISPTLSLIPILFSILIIAFNLFMQIPLAKLGKSNSQNLQSKNSFIFEAIQGAESIKTTNSLSNKIFQWRNIVAFADSIAHKMQSLHVLSMNISQFAVQLVVVLVVVVGVFEISNQQLSVGALVAISILSSRTIVPIVNLSGILIRLKEVKESVNRIDEFLSLPAENENFVEAGLGKIDGKIEFKNIRYKFQNSNYNSLDNVSFVINAGEKVGIIGQTGAGKSTLVKLILKLLHPLEGSIYIDNHDISTLHPVEIRQNIGLMPQDPFLFSGSLKDNIDLSRPISKAKMMQILKLTGLEELVKKSGQGDGLQVGERGNNLSVGQRHLVTLARALINNPPILILDEPTTGLDISLEKKLIENLKTNITQNQTLLVITHRLAALELVDRLIVISEGKIVADGEKEKVLKLLFTPQKASK